MFNKTYLIFPAFVVIALIHTSASASCEIVDGKTRKPFTGESLAQIMIERKSLMILNFEYPQLNVIEKTFTGEIQTCSSSCEGKYIICKETN